MVVRQFLQALKVEGGLIQLHTDGGLTVPRFVESIPDTLADEIRSTDAYFGPAARSRPGAEKGAVIGTRVLWVDVDDPAPPLSTLPPSFIVFSGHGWHLYWLLRDLLVGVDTIEHLNKILIDDVPNADKSCFNANRLLRLPGSVNTKEPKAIETVELKKQRDVVYTTQDIALLSALAPKTKHKIRTGDKRGYRSRSERDISVIRDLVTVGATDELIATIFEYQSIGDKVRDKDTAKTYLGVTIQKVRDTGQAKEQDKAPGPAFIEGREDGYYIVDRRREKRISTFTLTPTLLLDGSSFDAPDAIVVDVHANGHTWTNVTFPRQAFTSVRNMDRECHIASWQWLGLDYELRLLLPYLVSQLIDDGFPKVASSPVMGLHTIKTESYFLGNHGIVSKNDYWEGYSGPIAWLPSQKEHADVHYDPSHFSHEDLNTIAQHVPNVNEPSVLWPVLGWYAAAFLKPWIESKNLRFPILSLAGSTGSGKTSLVQRVMLPLFGHSDPKSYNADTTRFVILALLGGSNAIPVAFSEFRMDHVQKFLRYILLAYDTGHDPRGRADQSTVDYPLSAPFSVDGEDYISDPAALQRMVIAAFHPMMVAEGSPCWHTYKDLEQRGIPKGFAGYYIQYLLNHTDQQLTTILQEARTNLTAEFPDNLPDRIRNNHVVSLFGTYLWADCVGVERPPASVMRRSLTAVYDIKHGRAKMMIDHMVESIINHHRTRYATFKYSYAMLGDREVLYFQFSTAHDWWIMERQRLRRPTLERDALRNQLGEAPYHIAPKAVDGVWMHGVDLLKANETGLDVPTTFQTLRLSKRELKPADDLSPPTGETPAHPHS